MSDKFQIYKRKDTSGEKEDERTESFDELNRSTVGYLSQSVYGEFGCQHHWLHFLSREESTNRLQGLEHALKPGPLIRLQSKTVHKLTQPLDTRRFNWTHLNGPLVLCEVGKATTVYAHQSRRRVCKDNASHGRIFAILTGCHETEGHKEALCAIQHRKY